MLVFEQYTSFVCRGPNVRLKNCRFTFYNKRNYIYVEYKIQIGNPPQAHPKTGRFFENLWKQPGHNQLPYQIPAVKAPPLTTGY